MPTFRDDDWRAMREAEKLGKENERRAAEARVNIPVEGSEIKQAIELGLIAEGDRKDAAVIAAFVQTVLKTSFSNIREHRAREAEIAAGSGALELTFEILGPYINALVELGHLKPDDRRNEEKVIVAIDKFFRRHLQLSSYVVDRRPLMGTVGTTVMENGRGGLVVHHGNTRRW
jgi:hypothetical protein